jgi:hypothetical protein
MNSLIVPGVTVGKSATDSAGSIVKEDAPSNGPLKDDRASVSKKLPFGNR